MQNNPTIHSLPRIVSKSAPSPTSRDSAPQRSLPIHLGDLILAPPARAHASPKVVSALPRPLQTLLLELLPAPPLFRRLLRGLCSEPHEAIRGGAERPVAELLECLEVPVDHLDQRLAPTTERRDERDGDEKRRGRDWETSAPLESIRGMNRGCETHGI